jgi:hypothetical protein
VLERLEAALERLAVSGRCAGEVDLLHAHAAAVGEVERDVRSSTPQAWARTRVVPFRCASAAWMEFTKLEGKRPSPR